MKTISETISRHITPETFARREPKIVTLSFPIHSKRSGRHASYEDEVFNFLLKKKDALNIQSVLKLENLRVDGEILLSNGQRLAIEIKLRMNWMKACQSEWQFTQFLKTGEARINPVNGAIVFFEEFSADWARPTGKSRPIERGWNHWYNDYYKSNCYKARDFSVHLIRYRKLKLEGFPSHAGG